MQNALKILSDNNLEHSHIERSKIGFINSVFITDKYVIKIYNNISGFHKEKWFYENTAPDYAPKPVVIGKNYIVLKRIVGTGVYRIWDKINETQREKIVAKIAGIVSKLVNLDLPKDNDAFEYNESWSDYICDDITTSVSNLSKINAIDLEIAERVMHALSENKNVLNECEYFLCYNDLHFDNLIIDSDDEIYLIDYQTLCVAPKDFILDTWDRMSKFPYIYANEEDHESATQKDYINIVFWLKKYAPELFEVVDVEKRVALYGIRYDLHILFSYPNDELVVKRIGENLHILFA